MHIVVARGLTKDEAHWLEEKLIVAWNTTNPDKGYNISIGLKHAEDIKKKISDAKIDKKFSEKHKNKLSEAKKKSVICITTGRVFPSAREGASYYKLSGAGSITNCCKGKHKYAGEYNGQKLVWRYLEWKHAKKFRKLVSFSSF